MTNRQLSAPKFAVRGVAYNTRHNCSGKMKVHRFVAIDVFVVDDLVVVTEHSRADPSVRYDLGPACDLEMTIGKKLAMSRVTLVGNGHICSIVLSAAATSALQRAVSRARSESPTSEPALLVA